MKKRMFLVLMAMLLVCALAFGATAETVLRMATGYNSVKTGIVFDSETAGEGITLADGVTYHTGSLKPTWVELEKILGVKFESKY